MTRASWIYSLLVAWRHMVSIACEALGRPVTRSPIWAAASPSSTFLGDSNSRSHDVSGTCAFESLALVVEADAGARDAGGLAGLLGALYRGRGLRPRGVRPVEKGLEVVMRSARRRLAVPGRFLLGRSPLARILVRLRRGGGLRRVLLDLLEGAEKRVPEVEQAGAGILAGILRRHVCAGVLVVLGGFWFFGRGLLLLPLGGLGRSHRRARGAKGALGYGHAES